MEMLLREHIIFFPHFETGVQGNVLTLLQIIYFLKYSDYCIVLPQFSWELLTRRTIQKWMLHSRSLTESLLCASTGETMDYLPVVLHSVTSHTRCCGNVQGISVRMREDKVGGARVAKHPTMERAVLCNQELAYPECQHPVWGWTLHWTS